MSLMQVGYHTHQFERWPLEPWVMPYLASIETEILKAINKLDRFVKYNHSMSWRSEEFICIDYPHDSYIKLSIIDIDGYPNLTLQHVLHGSGGHNLMQPQHVRLDDPKATDKILTATLTLLESCTRSKPSTNT